MDSYTKILSTYLKKLNVFGKRLSVLRLAIILMMVFSTVFFILFILSLHKYVTADGVTKYAYADEHIEIALLISIAGIVLLFIHHIIKNRGMEYFKEISIEMEDTQSESYGKLALNYRIQIKEFLKSSELPFVTGRTSYFVYLCFFFVLILVLLLFKYTLVS